MAEPVARSPIIPAAPEVVVSGWAVSGRRSAAALTLCDHTPLAKVAVKAADVEAMAHVLGVGFGRVVRRGDLDETGRPVLVTGSGPGEWLIMSAPGSQGTLADRLEQSTSRVDGLVTVIDLTHGRALIRLTGRQAADLLAKETGIDLREAASPDGTALRTGVAGVATDLVRDDRDGLRSYLLHCERSSGQYLWDCLLDAGGEYGVDIDGFTRQGSERRPSSTRRS